MSRAGRSARYLDSASACFPRSHRPRLLLSKDIITDNCQNNANEEETSHATSLQSATPIQPNQTREKHPSAAPPPPPATYLGLSGPPRPPDTHVSKRTRARRAMHSFRQPRSQTRTHASKYAHAQTHRPADTSIRHVHIRPP